MATDAGENAVDEGFLRELCGRQIRAGAVDEKHVISRTEAERSLQICKPEKDWPEPMSPPIQAALSDGTSRFGSDRSLLSGSSRSVSGGIDARRPCAMR